MSSGLTALILGGYGTFGGRIVELLEDEPLLTLIVAGRSHAKAEAFCASRTRAKARLLPAAVDRDEIALSIAALRPQLLVDASGPFQAYGAAPYRVVEACLVQGVHYLDLADGAEFVAGVAAYDDAARAAGLFILSGVSSFPVLTAAVVRHLAADMAEVESIVGGIAPSPYAGVGGNVIRAIASYAGQPIRLRRNGAIARAYPFTEQKRMTVAPPGRLPLRSTLFSLVEVPDLGALAALWPGAKTVWMGAGPSPELLHRALIALAWLVRARLLPSLLPFASLMHWFANRLRWGEHRGGMFVSVRGRDGSGRTVARSWHMLAEGEDGPFIPSMAVEALLRKLLAGEAPSVGARAAVCELELDDYGRAFAGRAIATGVRQEEPVSDRPLYARLLGSAWDALPEPLRRMHAVGTVQAASGRACVERGSGLVARFAAWCIGFPPAMQDGPVTVRFEAAHGVERWTRCFGGQCFSSRQFAGRGRSAELLCERFGALTFAMALVLEDGRLSLSLRRWSLLGIPLPLWLCPRSDAFETVEDGRFHFHVEIALPWFGRVVRYRGWLAIDGG